MPAPYSLDLRRRVVAAALAQDATQAEVAARFAVSLTTVENWLRRYRASGTLTPTAPPHGPRRLLSDEDDARIAAYLKADCALTLAELAERFASETGRSVSDTTRFRSLVRSAVTRKKNALGRRAPKPREARRQGRLCQGPSGPRSGGVGLRR